MGIFGTTSPFDEVVVKATQETNTKEDWALILDICDRVSTSSTAPKECLRSIFRRLNHQDPHVVVQAITLLDACVSNCGLPFHLEVASRDFEQEFWKLLQKIQEKTVLEKLLKCLHKWAHNEFKSDPQLDLIPSLVTKLKSKGMEYSDNPHKPRKSSHHRSRDTTTTAGAASSSAPVGQEDADLAKAIELSLKETKAGPPGKSLYPQAQSFSGGNSSFVAEEKEPMKVRALYDFEAAEENELTFYTGEIVFVTDDSDTNWWQGSNQRGKGLFPANFVTTDLSLEPTKLEVASKKTVQFSEDVEVQSIETEPEIVEIDEAKIEKALHMLHDADPTGDLEDPTELAGLEDHVNQMGPLIDQELEKIDRRHAQLTRLGGELVEALNMYHNLMREPVGMGQPNMPYGMKMGMNVPLPSASMPQFPQHMGGGVQYSGYPSYDPNVAYPMMRPPHSAPAANGAGYSSIPYQTPQNNSMGQQPNMGIPNGQMGSQMPQQPNVNHATVMNPNMMQPGQILYTQAIMNPHGQSMQSQGYDSNPQGQHPMGIPQNMAMPQSGQNQQFGTPGSPHQVYHPQSPHSTAPNAPAV